MDDKTHHRINEYANCMFRFEKLPDEWIDSCTSYVKELFPHQLTSKIVIDYAFGRGNWSLAFLRGGADKVIAIDASIGNVNRFTEYCRKKHIKNIEIIHGNILTDDLKVEGDIIWLYGILPVIPDLELFLDKIKTLAKSKKSFIYVYFYNAGSLREFTVKWCRKGLTYSSEEAFLRDITLFLRPARLRARDDLTTPFIAWKSAYELKDLLRKHRIYVMRHDKDFLEFLNGIRCEEFYPIQFLCGFDQSKEIKIKESCELIYKKEIAVLNEMASLIFTDPKINNKKISIGLFNTHFAFIDERGGVSRAIIEIFLYLADILLKMKILYQNRYPSRIEDYLALTQAAISGVPRDKLKDLMGGNYITNYLCKHRIRI